jgi:hypothetical protein
VNTVSSGRAEAGRCCLSRAAASRHRRIDIRSLPQRWPREHRQKPTPTATASCFSTLTFAAARSSLSAPRATIFGARRTSCGSDLNGSKHHEAVCILSEQKALIAPYRRHFQRWETNMKIARMIAAGAALILVTCSGAIGAFSPAHALTHQELVAKLESAGYSRIQDINPPPKVRWSRR